MTLDSDSLIKNIPNKSEVTSRESRYVSSLSQNQRLLRTKTKHSAHAQSQCVEKDEARRKVKNGGGRENQKVGLCSLSVFRAVSSRSLRPHFHGVSTHNNRYIHPGEMVHYITSTLVMWHSFTIHTALFVAVTVTYFYLHFTSLPLKSYYEQWLWHLAHLYALMSDLLWLQNQSTQAP